jgi:hypothetical protein
MLGIETICKMIKIGEGISDHIDMTTYIIPKGNSGFVIWVGPIRYYIIILVQPDRLPLTKSKYSTYISTSLFT